MKKITMFYQENCPHCKKAFAMMKDLFAQHPEYEKIPLVKVEENKDPETANKYDYYYVPTFFVDDKKLHEGVPSLEAVSAVFEEAAK